MNILNIPSEYLKKSITDHINIITTLSSNKKIKIPNSDLFDFVLKINKLNLSTINTKIVIYGILYTIECIIRNQSISRPFGNNDNSMPKSGYEFYDKTGIYHSHILNDEMLNENLVLIWYLIKEDEDIEKYLLKFKYSPHPNHIEYKKIMIEIYNEPNTYHIEEGEYFESLHLKNEKIIYNFKKFKR